MISKRLSLLTVMTLLVVAFGFRLDRYLSLDTLRDHRTALLFLVESHNVESAIVYVLAYTAVVALSFPGATIMTMMGGFLFGVTIGAALAMIGATFGATLIFIVARSALGDILRARAGPLLARMADGFKRDAFSYLLCLRLVPVFPFWAANLAPALMGMTLRPFVAATAIGIIPITIAFSAFGANLGGAFDAGGEIRLKDVFSPSLIESLLGVGLLSLAPVAIRFARGIQR